MTNDFKPAMDLAQKQPWPISAHVFIIAEIGINHNGDVEIAKQLIDSGRLTASLVLRAHYSLDLCMLKL